MKIYETKTAPNPRRVRMFLAEKGIDDVEFIAVDVAGGAHRPAGVIILIDAIQAKAVVAVERRELKK